MGTGSKMQSGQPQAPRKNELIARLTRNPGVLGIVRYGRRRAQDIAPGGDLDLVVVVDERPPEVESIHFDVGGVSVDLSLRTFGDLRRDAPLSAVVDPLLSTAEILFDRRARFWSTPPMSVRRACKPWGRGYMPSCSMNRAGDNQDQGSPSTSKASDSRRRWMRMVGAARTAVRASAMGPPRRPRR